MMVNFASMYLKMPFYRAAGIGFVENGNILGGVVFDTYQTMADGKPLSVEASVIVIDKKWVTRYNLRELFSYSFGDLGVKRLCIRCGRSEKKKRALVLRLGFKYEGILREAWPFGGDAAVFSMLKHECGYLNGQLSQSPSSS